MLLSIGLLMIVIPAVLALLFVMCALIGDLGAIGVLIVLYVITAMILVFCGSRVEDK